MSFVLIKKNITSCKNDSSAFLSRDFEQVKQGLSSIRVYLDDILVSSNNTQEYTKNFRTNQAPLPVWKVVLCLKIVLQEMSKPMESRTLDNKSWNPFCRWQTSRASSGSGILKQIQRYRR